MTRRRVRDHGGSNSVKVSNRNKRNRCDIINITSSTRKYKRLSDKF